MNGHTNGDNGDTNGDSGGGTPSGNRWEPAPGTEPATPPLTAQPGTATYPITEEPEGGPASLRGLLSHWKVAAAGALLVAAGGAGGFAVGQSVSGDEVRPVSFGHDADGRPGFDHDADGGGPGFDHDADGGSEGTES